MRNLTIQRTKSFVACLGKMKVYIVDHQSFDTVINDSPCRLLGTLKNGEVKTFRIGEEATRVYVVADKLSRNYSNDYYNIPEGQEDISLSGKNCYNPGAGNPFRFDGVTDADVLANRKKGGKKGLLIMIIAVIVGLVIGFASTMNFDSVAKDKTFSEGGLSITLNNQFKINSDPGEFVALYESDEIIVFTQRESFTLGEGFGELTVKEYGEGLIKYNEQSARSQLKQDGDLYYFIYDDIIDHEYYTWVTYVYKTDDAFWYVDFVTAKEDAEEHRDQISRWAHTVTFE